jgi:N-acetylneuraminic acid mutarotase
VNPSYGSLGVTNGSNNPGSRSAPASWKDSSGNVWMFGGVTVSGGYDSKNDLWKYQPSSNQWTWMGGTQTTNASGVCGQQGTAAAGNVPGSRKSAASWIDTSGNLWLFGGVGYDCFGGVGHLNDLWKYTMSAQQWTWMGGPASAGGPGVYGTQGTGASGNYPSSRQQMAAWTDSSGNFWLFGGFGQDFGPNFAQGNCCGYGEFNDLWKYSPSSNQWTWVGGANIGEAWGVYGTQGVASSGNMPGARNNVQTGVDSSGNFWLFGGFGHDANGSRELLNDVWKYNAGSNQWTWVGGSSSVRQASSYGTKGVAAGGNTPGARQQFVTWVDSSGHLWVFGGEGLDGSGAYGQLNDLWKY